MNRQMQGHIIDKNGIPQIGIQGIGPFGNIDPIAI